MMRDDEALQQNNTSHISYKDYKKMLRSNKRNEFKLFIGAFCVLLLIFLGMAKMMSPDVDITLGDDTTQYEEYSPRGEVDDRLRDLQMEDESTTLGNEALNVEDGEKVSIPKRERYENVENRLPEEIYGQQAVKEVVGESKSYAQPEPKPTIVTKTNPVAQTLAPSPQSTAPAQSAKVIVGSYPTIEQAEVAKGILQDAGLGVNPFVRKLGNSYTLQVASYGTKEKAMSVVESLLNQNFPAKVIME